MKLPRWLPYVLAFLGGAVAALAAVLGRKPAGPTPADNIVAKADAEKQAIAEAIKADSDAALADRFNKLGGK